MVKQHPLLILITGFVLLILSTYGLANSNPIASVDRSVMAVDDSFTLTLRIGKAGSIQSPDLSPLDKNFHVLGSSQSSRRMISNGQSESWTEWIVTLMPKRKGELSIPPIEVDGKLTEAITIDAKASVPHSTNVLEPIYLETEVDRTSIYVQQQVIYTVRIFQSVQLDNMNISEPDFDNAAIEKLAQNTFQRRIQNTPYRVHELRYAIFPQQTGEFLIPELIFTASETTTRRSIFDFPGQGKPIRKMSKQHTVKVTNPPSEFAGNTWLPANSMTLTESWSDDPTTIRVGDSITRTITVKADGLMESQLPPFEFKPIDGAKLYPDQGLAERSITDSGVIATRIDSAAIIPTQQGVISLPEIRIDWWDTTKERMQSAVVPAQQFNVLPALGNSPSSSTPLAVDHSPNSLDNISNSNGNSSTTSIMWQILSLVLATAWLFTLALLWQAKKSPSTIEAHAATTNNTPSEKQAFKQLTEACNSDDTARIRKSLINWAQVFWQNPLLHSLQDILNNSDSKELSQLIYQLDQSIYGDLDSRETLDSKNLLDVIEKTRNAKRAVKKDADELRPLYNN